MIFCAVIRKVCHLVTRSISFQSCIQPPALWYLLWYLLASCLRPLSTGQWVTYGCQIHSSETTGYSKDGDVLIGGVFQLHVDTVGPQPSFKESPAPITCGTFVYQNYQWLQAMVFAIDEINGNPTILPNITLGFYIYDSCADLLQALKGTLWMLTGHRKHILNYSCQPKGHLAGIVGDAGSRCSIPMAQMLGLYRYPQVQADKVSTLVLVDPLFPFQLVLLAEGVTGKSNFHHFLRTPRRSNNVLSLVYQRDQMMAMPTFISYFSTSPFLSDRNQFPSFFRTIPSDDFQSQGLAQLVIHFNWTWVGLLAEDNDYGHQGVAILRAEIQKAGVCVAFSEDIILSRADRNADHIVQVIKNSTANAIVIFGLDSHLVPLLDEMMTQKITGKTFIASEAWSTSAFLSGDKYLKILTGTIGLAVYSGEMPGFEDYIKSVYPSNFLNDIFIKDFWEMAFGCKWQHPDLLWSNKSKICKGSEKVSSVDGIYKDVTSPRITYNVYKAVYAIALALHKLHSCEPGRSPFHQGTCASILDFHPWQVRTGVLVDKF